MNILVTGANGQLGMSLRKVIPDAVFTDVTPGAEYLDITDAEAVKAFVADRKIGIAVNCAAYTNVDKAESEPELAGRLNAAAPGNLAAALSETGGLLVHISTDYVFGGEFLNTPIKEDVECKPTSVYGITKLQGEEAIRRSGVRHVIIRTSWLYSEYGKNFVKTMRQLTSERPMLKVVFDQVGTPTYAGDLASAIGEIIKRPVEGIYHFSDEGVISWYDFTKAIAEYSGNHGCEILPCHSDEFPSPVRRPSYSVLDKTKIKETFGIRIPYWTESLRKCIDNLNK